MILRTLLMLALTLAAFGQVTAGQDYATLDGTTVKVTIVKEFIEDSVLIRYTDATGSSIDVVGWQPQGCLTQLKTGDKARTKDDGNPATYGATYTISEGDLYQLDKNNKWKKLKPKPGPKPPDDESTCQGLDRRKGFSRRNRGERGSVFPA
jgi:hypothetical protein